MKKSLLLVLVALIAVLMTASCSSSGEKKIEFMTGTGVDTPLFALYETLAKEFEAKNKNVKIELIPSSTNHEGEVKTRLASGDAPDIWMTHGWSKGRYAEYLVDLSKEKWAKDLQNGLKPVMLGKNGELYAFPIDLDIAGIIYSQTALDAAGVSIDSINTWDDFIAACEKLKAAGKTPLAVAGKDRWPTGLFIDWIAPGVMITQNSKEADLMSGKFPVAEWKQTLDVVAKFRDKGIMNKDYSSATNNDIAMGLAKGDVGFTMCMNFVAMQAFELKPDAKIGYMQVPVMSANDKPYYVIGEKNALGIWKDSKSLKEAKAFISFLAQKDNLTKLATSVGSPAGLSTVNVDLKQLTASFERSTKFAGQPYFDRVFMPNGAWDAIVATTEGVVLKQMSIDEAVAKMKSEYEKLYNQQK